MILTIGSIPSALRTLTRDGWLLFLTRFVRLFAYGSLSVVLVFYLISLGLSESQTGLLLTLTLVGDTVVSLYLTTRADRIGRRRMLIVGAILMAAAGLAFACTSNFLLLILAGTIGVISPSGNEVGPFLSIEQAALSHVVPARIRTEVFAWYTLAGSLATAIGALCGGAVTHALQKTVMRPVASYRAVVILYAALGVMLAFVFTRLSSAAEVTAPGEETAFPSFLGISRSRHVVTKLASLFALDSLCGGFRSAELRRVLVLFAFRCRTRNSRHHFLLGEHLCWHLVIAGIAACFPLWSYQHHGCHAPPLKHPSHSCAAHAKPLISGVGSVGAFQYQSNGRADQAVVHHGGCECGRTIRSSGNHRRST